MYIYFLHIFILIIHIFIKTIYFMYIVSDFALCFSECFSPEKYITLISGEMFRVLQKMQSYIVQSKDMSVEFVSVLLGKLCISGYGGNA